MLRQFVSVEGTLVNWLCGDVFYAQAGCPHGCRLVVSWNFRQSHAASCQAASCMWWHLFSHLSSSQSFALFSQSFDQMACGRLKRNCDVTLATRTEQTMTLLSQTLSKPFSRIQCPSSHPCVHANKWSFACHHRQVMEVGLCACKHCLIATARLHPFLNNSLCA